MDASVATDATVQPAARVAGRVRCPGDKSISHRYAILAALADGRSVIEGYAPGADCLATLECLASAGVVITRRGPRAPSAHTRAADQVIEIDGRGLGGLAAPRAPLDARNSGTTLRLLAGVLAAHPFESTLTGDASLRSRPMRRLTEPLTAMGAHLDADHDRPPLRIAGAALQGIDWTPSVPSAQIKSALLLAGLHATGRTSVREAAATRDHTEQALAAMGVEVERAAGRVAVSGGQRPRALTARVPGDVSSAAVWIAAAVALPGSDLDIADVGLNPTRTGILDVLRRAGADLAVTIERHEAGEPIGRVRVRFRGLHPLVIAPNDVPGVIDELPVLAAMATHPGGAITVTGAGELRVKETDRITALVAGLRALGADARELSDGFQVQGRDPISGGTVNAAGDHRLVMAFTLAALGAVGPSVILGADAVTVSYPGFFDVLTGLRA